MKNVNEEDKIISKYEQNMRRNEDALLEIRNKEKDLEEQEDNLHNTRMHLMRYCEELRERYVGTDEMIRYNRMESDILELTAISRKLLDSEYENIKKEEKQLYQQQERYYEEYLFEMKACRNKENS